MIKITDGNSVKEVTKGMFDNLYSTIGYKEVKEVKEKNESKNVEEEKIVENKEEVKVQPKTSSKK